MDLQVFYFVFPNAFPHVSAPVAYLNVNRTIDLFLWLDHITVFHTAGQEDRPERFVLVAVVAYQEDHYLVVTY